VSIGEWILALVAALGVGIGKAGLSGMSMFHVLVFAFSLARVRPPAWSCRSFSSAMSPQSAPFISTRAGTTCAACSRRRASVSRSPHGSFAGRWLLERIPQRLFEHILLAFAVLAALRLIGAF